jgi:hypothetical protein
MLVIIDHAITAFLSGGNPYAIHKVPWDAPLSYGPVLWLPLVLPHVLQVDVRILTLAAQCIVPMCLLWAAAISPPARAIALGALGVALAVNPDILRFHAIGHTQIYWPLLLLFSLCLADRRWSWAAVCLGLLVAARTTMISLVPVFFVYALASRGPWLRCIVLVGVSAAVPFVWFVIADPASVQYAMFGVYLKVMKGFVWYQTTWVRNTYGVTGWLLRRGLERYAEIVQVASLAVVYVLSWRSMKSGARPEPWLGLALLVFSMTTLWPVSYLYFDVWVLLASGLLATAGVRVARSPGRSVVWIACAGAASLIVILAVGAYRPGASYSLDIGDPSTSGFTGGGFGRDVAVVDDGRQVVWVEGETARVRMPRAGWSGATIRIAIRPQPSNANVAQRVSASINGHLLGAVTLQPGWQEIEFPSRGRDWRYGFNVLDLQFSYAVPSGADPRALSAAIDWVGVE